VILGDGSGGGRRDGRESGELRIWEERGEKRKGWKSGQGGGRGMGFEWMFPVFGVGTFGLVYFYRSVAFSFRSPRDSVIRWQRI